MRFLPSLLLACSIAVAIGADPTNLAPNRVLSDYFNREVATIEAVPLPQPQTLPEWETQRASLRKQLAEMLGLEPMPARTPLDPVKTLSLIHI